MRSSISTTVAISLAAVVVALDFVALEAGLARIGVARPLLVIALVTAAYWTAEIASTLTGLGKLRARFRASFDNPEELLS